MPTSVRRMSTPRAAAAIVLSNPPEHKLAPSVHSRLVKGAPAATIMSPRYMSLLRVALRVSARSFVYLCELAGFLICV